MDLKNGRPLKMEVEQEKREECKYEEEIVAHIREKI